MSEQGVAVQRRAGSCCHGRSACKRSLTSLVSQHTCASATARLRSVMRSLAESTIASFTLQAQGRQRSKGVKRSIGKRWQPLPTAAAAAHTTQGSFELT